MYLQSKFVFCSQWIFRGVCYLQ